MEVEVIGGLGRKLNVAIDSDSESDEQALTNGVKDETSLQDQKELELEKEMTLKEQQWLLNYEFLSNLKEIRTIIYDCMRFITRSGIKGKHPEEEDESSHLFELEDSRIVSFKSDNGVLSGFVSMEGFNIVEAEVNVKFPKRKKGDFSTMIDRAAAWRMTQISNAYHILYEVLEDLDDVIKLSQVPRTIEQATQILHKVASALSAAQSELLIAPRLRQPRSLSSSQKRFFPKLPKDLVIEFGISHNELVVSAVSLQQIKGKRPPGKVAAFTDGEKSYEYQEKAKVRINAKKLNSIFYLIEQAEVLCSVLSHQFESLQ